MAATIKECWGNCVKCGKFRLLGNGLCLICWDGDDGKANKIRRRWKHQRGVNRECLLCGNLTYVRPSMAVSRPNKGLICSECWARYNFPIPPRPIWIGNKRYSMLDRCPNCGEYLFQHLITGNNCDSQVVGDTLNIR